MSEFIVGQEVLYNDEEAVVCATPKGCSPATEKEVWIFNYTRDYAMCVAKSNLKPWLKKPASSKNTPTVIDLTKAHLTKAHFIRAARMEDSVPSQYRLGRLPEGTLVLQGAFKWKQGNEVGVTWKTLPTVDLPNEEEVKKKTVGGGGEK